MSAVGSLAMGLLLTGWLVVITRDLTALVAVTAMQGVLLAGVAALMGVGNGEVELFVAALLTLAVKGVAVPLVLRRLLQHIGPMRAADAIFTTRTMAVLALALTGVGYYIAAPLTATPGGHGHPEQVLPAAVALILVGTFVVVSRRLALTQAVGLLLIENGLFLAALGATGGVTLVVDVAILTEVVAAMLVMTALVRRMHGLMGSISTAEMRRLKG